VYSFNPEYNKVNFTQTSGEEKSQLQGHIYILVTMYSLRINFIYFFFQNLSAREVPAVWDSAGPK